LLGYANRANMGTWHCGTSANWNPGCDNHCSYRTAHGIGLNLEQQLTGDSGVRIASVGAMATAKRGPSPKLIMVSPVWESAS
jgi:hypothetical protein